MTMHAVIENVSRRRFLSSVATAAGFVVALQFIPFRSAFAYETGAGEMPHGTVNDPHIFVSIAEDGTVTIVRHRSEMGTGASTGVPMILADEMEADWSRVKLIQAPGDEPKYGNQDTDGSRSVRHYHPADAPVRRCHAPDAGAGGGQAVGRAGDRGRGRQPRGGPPGLGQEAGLRRARQGRHGPADPAARPAEAEGRIRLPLHGQGQRPGLRHPQHHHRSRHLRPGHPPGRHEVCRGGASARGRRQGEVVRLRRCPEGPGCREGDRDPGRRRSGGEVRAVGRRGRDRQQHLRRDQGPRSPQDRLGRRPQRIL